MHQVAARKGLVKVGRSVVWRGGSEEETSLGCLLTRSRRPHLAQRTNTLGAAHVRPMSRPARRESSSCYQPLPPGTRRSDRAPTPLPSSANSIRRVAGDCRLTVESSQAPNPPRLPRRAETGLAFDWAPHHKCVAQGGWPPLLPSRETFLSQKSSRCVNVASSAASTPPLAAFPIRPAFAASSVLGGDATPSLVERGPCSVMVQ